MNNKVNIGWRFFFDISLSFRISPVPKYFFCFPSNQSSNQHVLAWSTSSRTWSSRLWGQASMDWGGVCGTVCGTGPTNIQKDGGKNSKFSRRLATLSALNLTPNQTVESERRRSRSDFGQRSTFTELHRSSNSTTPPSECYQYYS